ncbi:hypothetical protein Efla_007195 [Eimeria flavescens]
MESSHQHMEEMPFQLPAGQLRPQHYGRAFALANGITMHLLDYPIATTFANSSSEVIRFAAEPLELQCQGHRSFVQSLVSTGVLFGLRVGLDWLQNNNPRADLDHGFLMLSDSDYCYKLEAAYSDAAFHDESVAISSCTARQIRPYPAAHEAYCNYISTIQKAPEEAQPQAIPPAVFSILQDFPDIQKEPTTLPPPRNHQHAIPLYPDAEPERKSPYRFDRQSFST